MSETASTIARKRAQRRGGSRPTVADVARVAEVSPMTVSRVINGESSVSADTRDRVMTAIARLRYVPNPAARTLAGGGQCRLALLYDNPSAAFLSELLLGSLEQARRSDVQLLLESHDPAEPVEAMGRRLREHRIDGVLIPAPLCDMLPVVEGLAAQGLPLVRVAATVPCQVGDAVQIDDEGAAHAMAARLIGLGHRRIGFLAGAERYPVSALRLAGYARALREAGIAPDARLIARGEFTYRSGFEAAEQLLALEVRPTALFASNDDMAAGALAAAHRHGLDVPRHLSVCGFDDTALARSVWPELTTVRQPAAAMAASAVDLLVERIAMARRNTRRPDRIVPVAFEIVGRASDAPPA